MDLFINMDEYFPKNIVNLPAFIDRRILFLRKKNSVYLLIFLVKRRLNMKLYLIHVGFYDPNIMDGLYEQHANYFVVAENVVDAKKRARQNTIYNKKKMHIDGIQELNIIDGYRINLIRDDSSDDTLNYSYDDVKTLK